ncbi:RraA family protein [Cohnella pontilimi]|uniref:Putative 4-hydroxy-4-methyl-2-oxoglutarate aldolase n=1 Tax=Cohnella pontilimi TaxID=2564100 RepID=A0A4U0FC86_9BACL|nr:RraA family protein [Cohnella pontilimi]TJY42278.1 RraA family protein [Cohnella pontilimi]
MSVETNQTTVDDRQEILELYKDLRVTDVRDGMDWMGMHHYGTMHRDIKPLWRTKITGIARTARYLPFEGPAPKLTPEEYTKWVSWYYKEVCYDPWAEDIVDGDIMVIDVCGLDVGLLGSNNTLSCLLKGCRGYILNGGGIRDTDEVIMQKIPVWSKFVSQGMDQARIRYHEKDIPVAMGGVAVYPGDVIVADGDGVIVVPRKMARDVAKYATQELRGDKAGRRRLYQQLGWELDETVLD